MESDSVQIALNLAYFYLKFRIRTEKEIIDYLEKKGVKKEIINKAITHLKNVDLINDEKFIRIFVEHRNLNKPKSSFVLKRELLRLGIKPELLNQFFLNNPTDELSLAKKALVSKIKFFSQYDKKTRFKKIVNFLLRRGFSYQTAKETYSLYTNTNEIYQD